MSDWHREYRYRKAMGGTHADYMDTDQETIEAMIRIEDAYAESAQRQQAQQARNNG